jgi:hypothetical protein
LPANISRDERFLIKTLVEGYDPDGDHLYAGELGREVVTNVVQ